MNTQCEHFSRETCIPAGSAAGGDGLGRMVGRVVVGRGRTVVSRMMAGASSPGAAPAVGPGAWRGAAFPVGVRCRPAGGVGRLVAPFHQHHRRLGLARRGAHRAGKFGSSTGLLGMGVGDWRRLPIDRRGRGGPQRAQSLERNARSGKPESPAAFGISGGFHPIYFLPLRSQGPLLPLRLPGVRRALSSETDEEPKKALFVVAGKSD